MLNFGVQNFIDFYLSRTFQANYVYVRKSNRIFTQANLYNEFIERSSHLTDPLVNINNIMNSDLHNQNSDNRNATNPIN